MQPPRAPPAPPPSPPLFPPLKPPPLGVAAPLAATIGGLVLLVAAAVALCLAYQVARARALLARADATRRDQARAVSEKGAMSDGALLAHEGRRFPGRVPDGPRRAGC